MLRKSTARIVLLLGTSLLPMLAHAQILGGSARASVSSEVVQLSDMLHSSPVRSRSINKRFDASLPRIGVASVRFLRAKGRTWNATFQTRTGVVHDSQPLVLLEGEIVPAGSSSQIPIAGALSEENNEPVLRAHFIDTANTPFRQAYELVVPLLEPTAARIDAALVSELEGKACGGTSAGRTTSLLTASSLSDSGGGAPTSSAAGSILEAEMSTDADYEWFQRYGSASNTRVATIVNALNVIYRRDLGLSIVINDQNTWSSASDPYTSTDSGVLLDQFLEYRNAHQHIGAADVYHLFSGKDFDSNVIGRAYLGVVCRSPSFSYGVTQRFSDTLDHIIVAHEVGHNFDAEHDTANANTIMNPSISSNSTTFSTVSAQQINAHMSAYGGCLAAEPAPSPTPSPTPSPSPTPTPSPTPSPSPSPTPSPDPSPTPTPGGPSGDDPAPEPREVPVEPSLSSRFDTRRGVVSISIGLAGEISESCMLELQTSGSSTMARVKRKVLSYTVNRSRYRLTASALPRAARNGPGLVYFRARYACPIGTKYSPTRAVRVPRSRARSAPSISAWIGTVAKKLK